MTRYNYIKKVKINGGCEFLVKDEHLGRLSPQQSDTRWCILLVNRHEPNFLFFQTQMLCRMSIGYSYEEAEWHVHSYSYKLMSFNFYVDWTPLLGVCCKPRRRCPYNLCLLIPSTLLMAIHNYCCCCYYYCYCYCYYYYQHHHHHHHHHHYFYHYYYYYYLLLLLLFIIIIIIIIITTIIYYYYYYYYYHYHSTASQQLVTSIKTLIRCHRQY